MIPFPSLRLTSFDEGLALIEDKVIKLMTTLDGSKDFCLVYSCLSYFCREKPDDLPDKLYCKYKEYLKDYISSMVLPYLTCHRITPVIMWKEVLNRLADYKIFVEWLSQWFGIVFFHITKGYGKYHPSLNEVALECFNEMVFLKLKFDVRDAQIGRLISENNVVDLSSIYQIICMMPEEDGLKPASELFKKHIIHEGMSLVKLVKSDPTITNQVLTEIVMELLENYLCYVTSCFNHLLFNKALGEAFEEFCRTYVDVPFGQVLAMACDTFIKHLIKGRKEDINVFFDKVVMLLADIKDKDIFLKFYRKYLADRLLVNKWSFVDLERQILTKISCLFDRGIMFPLVTMVFDLTLAKSNQKKFEDYINGKRRIDSMFKNSIKGNLVIDSSTVAVLNKFQWPRFKPDGLKLPLEMARCISVFEDFHNTTAKYPYGKKTPDTYPKKVTCVTSLGTCAINAQFGNQSIEIVVTTYQAVLLLLFNEADRLSFEEIRNEMNLSDHVTRGILHSVSCGKYKILQKEPDNETISPTDIFAFNEKFTHDSRRIKIPLPFVEEKEEVVKKLKKSIEVERSYMYEPAIVRIMKRNGTLEHTVLVDLCRRELRFNLDLKDLKATIEDLINDGYLARDKEDPNRYKYLPCGSHR